MANPSETTSLLPGEKQELEQVLDGNTMEAEDPDTIELPEDDVEKEEIEMEDVAAGEQKTLLRPDIEAKLDEDHPETSSWLKSLGGFMLQYGIILFAVLLACYEAVLKGKAATVADMDMYGFAFKQAKKSVVTGIEDEKVVLGYASPEIEKDGEAQNMWQFDMKARAGEFTYEFSTITLWTSVLSIIVGLVLAAKNRELKFVFSMESLKMCMIFQPAAIGFAISQFMGFFNLTFLDPDVLKVLDQSRLIVTALVMVVMLGKRYSRATWNSLIVITLASIMYGITKMSLRDVSSLEKLKDKIVKGDFKGNLNIKDLDVKASGDDAADSGKFVIGFLLVIVNATVMAFAGVWAEKKMKAYKSTPFYIQKMYLEIGGMLSSLAFLYGITPPMKKALKGRDDPATVNVLGYNPFAGWSNPYVIVLFIVFFSKNYLQGILVKRMSSLVKQLSQVVATALVYFASNLHTEGCNSKPFEKAIKAPFQQFMDSADFKANQYNGNWDVVKALKGADVGKGVSEIAAVYHQKVFGDNLDGEIAGADKKTYSKDGMSSFGAQFFCARGSINTYMVLVDLLVLISVVSYIFANRDKTRKQMYKKERDDANKQP